ncbi:MAG: SusD/RagB family nutrient-binding outer membrane lipoprotein, partial [Chryseobacterium sp.]
MRNRKNFLAKSIAIMLMLCSILSCSKFGDLNIDPERSSDMNPENQLVFAQLWFSGDLSTQERTNAIILVPMMQQFAGAYYTRVGAVYVKDVPRMWVLWENSYQNDVVNIIDAVERTNGDPTKVNLNAMCRIMKVYTFARLTDIYGDIPYKEAGKGYLSKIISPKYDPQEEIYDDFLKELKEASAQLTTDASSDRVTSDIFYQGNVNSWKKFANSLRIRLAMRLVKRNPDKAKAEVLDAYNAAGGVFTSNSDICMTKHLDVQNDYADLRGNSASVAINQQPATVKIVSTFLNQLKNTNDPRLNSIPRVYRQNSPLRPFEREDITTQIKNSHWRRPCRL